MSVYYHVEVMFMYCKTRTIFHYPLLLNTRSVIYMMLFGCNLDGKPWIIKDKI